jgi:hypothetical protein
MEAMGHGLAHIIHALDEIFAQAVIDPMIMDAINAIIIILILLAPGNDVKFVSPAVQAGGEFSDMDAESPGGDGVQRLR